MVSALRANGEFYCLLINGDAAKPLNSATLFAPFFTIRTILSFLKSFFDGYDTCCKHAHYFFCISIQAIKEFFIYVVCSLEKF